MTEKPKRLSEVCESSISPDLENLVMETLSKQPDARPASAQEFIERLNSCQGAATWGAPEAKQWWDEYASEIKNIRTLRRSAPTGADTGAPEKTLQIDHGKR